VQAGDTLSQIAQANGVSVQELVGLNPQLAADAGAVGGQNLNPDVIFPGQEITLPPASGADVYAGGVGTNANTMADIAKGNVPDSSITQTGSLERLGGVDAADVSQAAADPGKYSAPIDYSQSGPTSTDSLGQKLEYGIPVNDKGSFIPPNAGLPADELARQTAAYDAWKADFTKRFPSAELQPDGSMKATKPGLAPMYPSNYTPGSGGSGSIRPKGFTESVKLIRLPVSQLIDKKTTILNWKLNESIGRKSKTVNLTTAGAYTVFENVDRYRKAIMELKGVPGSTRPALYRPDMAGAPVAPAAKKPGLLSRGLSKVGGALSTFGRQFTTNVTKEKLKMNWHQKGKPSDSDQLAAWLVTQGVPQEVVTSVYSKMGLPVAAATVTATPTAPTVATPTAPTTATPTAPTTATPTTATATTTKPTAPAAAAGKFPGEDPQGAGYVGRREVARRQAARAAGAAKPAPAKTPNFSGPTGYSSVNTTVKQPAKQPAVAEGAMPAAVIRIKEKIRQMSDAEKKEYFQGKTREQLQQLARRHGYGENSNVYAKYAAQGLNEFAPGSGGDDDIGDDPYKYPKPTQYRRSADYFGQFEADHFEREDFDDATGVFKGYWGDKQIAYFKFNKPTQTGGDDPGRGWYYEPQSDSSDNTGTGPAVDRSDERKQQELGMIRAFLKSGNRPNPDSQIGRLMKKHGIEEDLSRRGFLQGLGAAAAGAVGVGAAGSAQARSTDASRKEDAEALALLAKGMTPEQVAKKLGVPGPNHGQTHHMGGRWASINRATAQLQRQRGAEIKESVSASTVDELESMLKSAGLGRNG
jgi:LysM repeat protein